MSAFNQARYNLARYNVPASGQVYLEGAARVTFGFSFAGQTFYCTGNSLVRILAPALTIDKGQVFRGAAAELFAQQTYANGYCRIAVDAVEVFAQETNVSQIAYIDTDAAETIDAELNLSQIAYADGSGETHLDTELNLSQIANLEADTGEVFFATADVISLIESVCEFPGLTLRPGQTLVVDAGTFNVLLDGENAIYLQSGEWLDNLNRNTQSITISGTGATRLTAEILYTERYL